MLRTILLSGALLVAPGCAVSPVPAESMGGDTAPPESDPVPDSRGKVAVNIQGEDLYLDVQTASFASALDPGPPRSARCIIRLCRPDGRVAGPASGGLSAYGRGGDPDGWTADFVDGGEASLLFRRESDGMFWRVAVVPEFLADGIRWRVVGKELICIR